MKSSNYVRLICGLGAFFYTTLLSAQWHGYGTQLSESSLQLRGLPSVPELHTDMPLDCLIGYVAMDSIARTIGVFEAARYPENTIIPQLRIVGFPKSEPLRSRGSEARESVHGETFSGRSEIYNTLITKSQGA